MRFAIRLFRHLIPVGLIAGGLGQGATAAPADTLATLLDAARSCFATDPAWNAGKGKRMTMGDTPARDNSRVGGRNRGRLFEGPSAVRC